MQHTDALKRLRNLFHRDEAHAPDALSGPTLADQEPDLERELARNNVAMSAWAASGHPTD